MKLIKNLNNSSRNTRLIDYSNELFPSSKKIRKKVARKLFKIIISRSGRNNQGKITVHHRGGRHKRFYRIIDFKRYHKDGIKGVIKSIEYNPGSRAFISLVNYEDKSFSLILAPEGIEVEDEIISGEDKNVPIELGNNLPLRHIPNGIEFHNLESKLKGGGKLIRGAGCFAKKIGEKKLKGKEYALVKLNSGETKLFLLDCRASIGRVSNSKANLVSLGKAGRNR